MIKKFSWIRLALLSFLISCGSDQSAHNELKAIQPTLHWGTFNETIAGFDAYSFKFYGPSKQQLNFNPPANVLNNRQKLFDLLSAHLIEKSVPFKVEVVINTNGIYIPNFIIKNPIKRKLEPLFKVATVKGGEFKRDRDKLFEELVILGLNSYNGDKLYVDFDGQVTKAGLITRGQTKPYAQYRDDFLVKYVAGQMSTSANPEIREAIAASMVKLYYRP